MEAGGQLVAGQKGPNGRLVKGPILDVDARARLWRLATPSKLEAFGCVPGNMTRSIRVTANGKTTAACAAYGANPALQALIADVNIVMAPAREAFAREPPPLPPLPPVLWLEVQRDGEKPQRLVRLAGVTLPESELRGARVIDDATATPIWERLLRSSLLAGLSFEIKAGVPLPGAPYRCEKGQTSVRVRIGVGDEALVRQGCISSADSEPMRAAVAAIVDAGR